MSEEQEPTKIKNKILFRVATNKDQNEKLVHGIPATKIRLGTGSYKGKEYKGILFSATTKIPAHICISEETLKALECWEMLQSLELSPSADDPEVLLAEFQFFACMEMSLSSDFLPNLISDKIKLYLKYDTRVYSGETFINEFVCK